MSSVGTGFSYWTAPPARFGCAGILIILGRTLLNPTSGSLKRDLIERVYIPKGPPNPNSQIMLTLLTTVMFAVC